MATLNTHIYLRHDTATAWETYNPVLGVGEIGYESDTGMFKFGDGTTAWNDLGYFETEPVTEQQILAAVTEILANYETEEGTLSLISVELAKLLYTDTAVENYYVSSVSQENGQISVTRAELPVTDLSDYYTKSETDSAVDAATATAEEYTDEAIQALGSATAGDGEYVTGVSVADDGTLAVDTAEFSDLGYATTDYVDEQIGTVSTAVEGLDERLATAESEIETLETTVDSLGDTYATKEEVAEDVESLEASISEVSETVTGLDTRLTTAEESIETLESTVDSLGDTYATKEDVAADVATLTESIDEISGEVEELDGRVGTLEDEITGLTGAMHYVGESTTDPIEDGATIEGHTGDFENGDVCIYGDKEYIYANGAWAEFGDTGDLVTKDEFDQTLDNYYTSEETDAAIAEAVEGVESEFATYELAMDEEYKVTLTKTVGEETTDAGNFQLGSAAVEDADTFATAEALTELIGTVDGIDSAVAALQETVGDADSGLVADVAALQDVVGDETEGLVADVTDLKEAVDTLETTVGDDESGLVKDVADLTTAVSALEDTVGDEDNGLVADVAALQDVVGDEDSGLVADVAALQTAVESLEGSSISTITSTDESITVTPSDDNTVDIAVAAVAVDLLTQDDWLVLDCGSADGTYPTD